MKKKQSDNEVLEYIYSKIKDGTLKVGDKLPTERQIAGELGLGRNSIREATSMLHGMGLIESIQGSGNFISENVHQSIRNMVVLMVSLGSITKEEVCEYRKTMEKSVCHLLITKGISDGKKKEIEEVLSKMEKAEGQQQFELDRQFHNLMVDATDNTLLSILMDSVMTVIRDWIEVVLVCADKKDKKELQKCHRGIFEGVLKKDRDTINEYIDRHYNVISKNLELGGKKNE